MGYQPPFTTTAALLARAESLAAWREHIHGAAVAEILDIFATLATGRARREAKGRYCR